MALARVPADAEVQHTTLTLCLGHASDILKGLGNKVYDGATLFQHAAADPTILKRWSGSKGTTPIAAEKKAFGRLALALIDGGMALGYDRAPPPPIAAAVAPPTAENPLRGSPPTVVRARTAAVYRVVTAPPSFPV